MSVLNLSGERGGLPRSSRRTRELQEADSRPLAPGRAASRRAGPPGLPADRFRSPAARFFASSSPGARPTGPARAPPCAPRRAGSVEPSAAPRRPSVPELLPFLRPKRADLQAERSSAEARGVRRPTRPPKSARGPPKGPLLPSGWHQFAGKRARKKDAGEGGNLPRSSELHRGREADSRRLMAV